jgi:flagellar basal body-associated protein FliL
MEIIIIILLVLLVVALAAWVAYIEWRYRKLASLFRLLMTGRGGADLETTLLDFVSRMDRIEQTTQTTETRVASLEVKQPYLVQHVGVVRFNPFSDKGGDQSFVLAILDDHADGAVVSALHTRTDVRIYAKPIVGRKRKRRLPAR